MQSGGGAYSWYINKFCQYEQNLAQRGHKSIYDILEQELANTSVGSNGLLFLPYLIGERSPWWNTNAKANFIGLKMEHQRKDLLRAIQEGVAMNLNIILNIFKELWGKTDGRTYKHYVQSYHEDEEITPEQAHKNAVELAEHTKAWKGHEVLIATHIDKGHIHTHFIVNSVNYENGHKLQWM